MNVREQIKKHLATQPEPKRSEMQELHRRIIRQMPPRSRLWFLDGKDENNKTVANPNIGYGVYTIKYASGETREFFQIGLSGNTAGISVYVMGLKDKTYLVRTFGKKLGKATVTGYCIRFKTLEDINLATLEAAIRHGAEATAG